MVDTARWSGQWKQLTCILLALWGLVNLQRFAPGFLGNYLIEEFGLSLTQFGFVAGLFMALWAIGSLAGLLVLDRYGRGTNLVIASAGTAVFSWIGGAVGTIFQLLAIRSLIGFGAGVSWLPIASTIHAFTNTAYRVKMLIVFFALAALIGGIVGAPLITNLAVHYGWHGSLFITAVPLIILSFVLWRISPDLQFSQTQAETQEGAGQTPAWEIGAGEAERANAEDAGDWQRQAAQAPLDVKAKSIWLYTKMLFRQRNIGLSGIISVAAMGHIFILIFYGKLYLLQVLGLGELQAGNMMAILLAGSLLGGVIMAALVYKTGQCRLITLVCAGAALVFGLLMAFQPTAASFEFVLGLMFLFAFWGGGVLSLALIVMPFAFAQPKEVNRAIGTIYFCGEFVGGAILVMIAGKLGDLYGLPATMLLSAAMMAIALIASDKLTATIPTTALKAPTKLDAGV